MPLFSSLVHQVSENTEYLQRTLRPAAQHDSFTAKLLSILADGGSNSKQSTSKISLGLHRSDYMLDEPSNTLLQVWASRFLYIPYIFLAWSILCSGL
jgi:glutathione synthase